MNLTVVGFERAKCDVTGRKTDVAIVRMGLATRRIATSQLVDVLRFHAGIFDDNLSLTGSGDPGAPSLEELHHA